VNLEKLLLRFQQDKVLSGLYLCGLALVVIGYACVIWSLRRAQEDSQLPQSIIAQYPEEFGKPGSYKALQPFELTVSVQPSVTNAVPNPTQSVQSPNQPGSSWAGGKVQPGLESKIASPPSVEGLHGQRKSTHYLRQAKPVSKNLGCRHSHHNYLVPPPPPTPVITLPVPGSDLVVTPDQSDQYGELASGAALAQRAVKSHRRHQVVATR
jgi:hypothetical protein